MVSSFEGNLVQEAMKPHAQNIMQVLLNLTNEIDMDTLTEVMEQLVQEFAAELTPFAVQLTAQLVRKILCRFFYQEADLMALLERHIFEDHWRGLQQY